MNGRARCLAAALGWLLLGEVAAAGLGGPALRVPDREYPLTECFGQAARTYEISVELLWAIARVESNLNPAATGYNKNGTRDLGLMQINSSHLPRLSAQAITAQRLLSETCLNVHVGAWILRENLDRYGPTWEAVGAYNASEHRRDLRLDYARKVHRKLQELFTYRYRTRGVNG